MAKSKSSTKSIPDELPTRISTNKTSPDSAIAELQPELFDDCGMCPFKKSHKNKIFFVVMERATFSPDVAVAPVFYREWRWAHTKSWARTLARRARDEGWNIVDIFPGTKAHITHKYRGLKK